jgi:hypothetical protein
LLLVELRGTPTPRPVGAGVIRFTELGAGQQMSGWSVPCGTAAACGQALPALRPCALGTPAALTVAARGTPQPAQAPRAVVGPKARSAEAPGGPPKRRCDSEHRMHLNLRCAGCEAGCKQIRIARAACLRCST